MARPIIVAFLRIVLAYQLCKQGLQRSNVVSSMEDG